MLWRYSEMSGYPWTFSHGPGQPDAIARELKYHGPACCARCTMPTERLWTTCWMVTGWLLTQQKKEDGGTAKDGLTVFNRAFSLLKLELVAR